VATQIRSEIQGNNCGVQAHQINAFTHVPTLTQGEPERQSVFKRVGQAHTTELTKRAKHEGFITQLADHE
jgi:hypothetical protein